MTAKTPVPRAGLKPRFIGLFVLWQLAVIPLVNLFEFIPLRPTMYDVDPPIETAQHWGRFTNVDWLQDSAETVGYLLAMWGEATGQDQGWIMFTPGFPPNTVVLIAEFRFADGTMDRVASRFYPPSLTHPAARWPVINDREFNFEANIFMLAWECGPNAANDRPEELRNLLLRVRENAHLVAAWLRWQTHRYRARHPERPEPTEVRLVLQYIPTPLPGEPSDWSSRPVFERPFARMRPDVEPVPGLLAVDGYDPIAYEFVPLPVWSRP